MTSIVGQIARAATAVAGGFIVLVALMAGLTVAVNPAGALALHFGFAHVPRLPSQALAIFLNNLPLLCVPLLMAANVHARMVIHSRGWRRIYTSLCDLVAIVPLVHAGLVVGQGVGQYGVRMVAAMLPSGPVEIAAFALATAVYIQSRRAATIRALASLVHPAVASVMLLATAAVLEALL